MCEFAAEAGGVDGKTEIIDNRKQLYRHLELSGQREKALAIYDACFGGGKLARGVSRGDLSARIPVSMILFEF